MLTRAELEKFTIVKDINQTTTATKGWMTGPWRVFARCLLMHRFFGS